MLILLDNTVLSNFASIKRSNLVQLALSTAATTDTVWHELQVGITVGKLPNTDWSWLQVLVLKEDEQKLMNTFSQSLGAGEASCLAVAVHRQGRVFTDDRDARKAAAQLQIPVSGTLGILVRLIDLEHLLIPEADSLLTTMISVGYRSPITSLQQLL